MTPEETFEKLLGLGSSWKVISTDYEVEKNTFVICVEETAVLWAEESVRNGHPVTCYDHVEPMQWRHLNVFNKECVIVSALPRGRRSRDGSIYRVTPPWEGRSKHFSKEFEAFALTLMREMPVKKAGEIMGETDQRLWRMLHAHVEAAHARVDWSEVVWVGADEMNRKKGHNYITVFADLANKRVLYGTEGKDASVWERFAQQFEAHNGHPKSVTQVAKSQWIFRKNPEAHTERELERIEQMDWKHLMTVLAYQMRLILQDIYQGNSVRQARSDLKLWCQWVKDKAAKKGNELLQPMVGVAQMIERHIEGILGHWKEGLTTAFLEGLNSLFSATKRKARGYRTTKNLLAMLYFVAGKLRIPCY